MTPSPTLSFTASFLASDRAFQGIGPKRAQALYNTFGKTLFEKMRRVHPDVVSIIGEEAALVAAAALEIKKADVAFVTWLGQIKANIPTSAALRLARAWGQAGLKAVQDNPYLLLAVSQWHIVDKIALNAGLGPASIERQVGAIEQVLKGPHGLEGGHTLVTHDTLRQETTKLLDFPLSLKAVKACLACGAAIERPEGFQPAGAAWMEKEVADAFLRLSKTPLPEPCSFITPDPSSSLSFPLTDKQTDAVRLSQQTRLFVLGGYAGSGKTTTLRSICDAHETAGRTPLIVTLSGRAAQRAREATGRQAMTLAKFMVLHDSQKLEIDETYALIVDEASMLSLSDIWRIVRRLNEACLLLCGDPAQLSPIGFGLVFHRLFGKTALPSIVLDQVLRQSAASGIPTFAASVRDGVLPDIEKPGSSLPGVSFMPCTRDSLLTTLEAATSYCRKAGYTADDIQIIAPTHRDISAINTHFHTQNKASGSAQWGHNRRFCVNDPLIWNTNLPDRDLTNGSMGRLLAGSPTPQALFDGSPVDLTPQDEPYIDLAYAISIHKSQGSQWPCVIVPIFQNRLLERALVYTAITRGMNHVILIGDKSALNTALASQKGIERRVSFLLSPQKTPILSR